MLDMFLVDEVLLKALAEDIGTGDITTRSTVPSDKKIKGSFIAKEGGVICGLDITERIFYYTDPKIKLRAHVQDGEMVEKGTIIADISGSAQGILTGERVALNFIQRMSGIATRTRECVEAIKGTKAVISDTRKTTPGLRIIEKYAVKIGGGTNHRFNLSDGILIKDNHIKAAGGISAAVDAARKNAPHTLKIEVEVEDFEMIKEALDCKADIIMLDNMSIQDMKKAVGIIGDRALVEASGNMGEKDLAEVANTGVDIISIGALTHSVRSMDISLKFS